MAAAIAAFQKGRLADAEGLCRAALAVDPKSFDALHLLGAIAAQGGRLDAAIALLGTALEIRPDSADARCNLGEFLRRRGDLDQAAASFVQAIALNGKLPAAHNGLGLVRLSQNRVADAIAAFRAAIAIAPDFADAWHNLGLASMMDGAPEAAIDAYRQALALTPGRLETLRDLGNVYLATDDFERAAEIFAKALTVRQDLPQATIGLARARAELGIPGAVDEFRNAIRAAPEDLNAQHAYGNFLMDWGHFGEAATFFAENTKIAGARVRSLSSLAFSRKFTEAEEAAIDAMIAASREAGLSDEDRATLLFATGKALDDRRRYAEAIVHFDQANRLWRTRHPFDRRAHDASVDRIIAAYDAAALDRLKPVANGSDRPILIAGMPRSGTTLVEQILAAHPDVAAGGEMQFWTRRFVPSNAVPSIEAAADGAQAIEGYLAALSRISPDAERVTDKQPYNFTALGVLHALFPNARFIHCRRDPVDTALSIYFTRFAAGNAFASDRGDIVACYRGYRRLMAHWRPLVAADRLIEIDYERLVAEPESTTRALLAFCGLDWNEACLKPELTARSVRTASAWQVRQPIYRSSAERWRNYEPWLGALAALDEHQDGT